MPNNFNNSTIPLFYFSFCKITYNHIQKTWYKTLDVKFIQNKLEHKDDDVDAGIH